jgi:hypothetical protein
MYLPLEQMMLWLQSKLFKFLRKKMNWELNFAIGRFGGSLDQRNGRIYRSKYVKNEYYDSQSTRKGVDVGLPLN